MIIIGYKNYLAFLLFTLVLNGVSYAQNSIQTPEKEGVINIEQDERLNELLAYKAKLNKTDNEKRFRIQIYNGTLEGAQEARQKFISKYEDLVCDIVFETPNYKVRVGKFRTRLETDRYLLKLKEEYPSAFLLQP